MKNILFFPVILFCLASILISCDDLFGDEEEEPAQYEGPIAIRNIQTLNVNQFNYSVQWEVVDGSGTVIDPNDINYQYEVTYGTQGESSGSGQGVTFTPDINRNEQGQQINVTQICGLEIPVKITAYVEDGRGLRLEALEEISVFPPACVYELYAQGEFSGNSSNVCDYWSEFTYSVRNLTYESFFGNGSEFIQFFDDNTGYNSQGSINVEIAESRILDATNSTVDEQPFFRIALSSPSSIFQILGPQVTKVDCQQPAIISFEIDFNLQHIDGTVIKSETITKQFNY